MVPCFFLFFFGLNHKLRRYWWSPVSVGGVLLNQLQRKLVGLNSWAVSQDLLKYDGLIPQPKAKNCYKLSVKRGLKAKRCFQDKTAWVHAGERTETFTAMCSKAHRLRRARGASVVAQQSLVVTRAPRGEKAPSGFSTASPTPLKPCTAARSAPPRTRCMSVFHQSVRHSLTAFPMCQNKLWRTKKLLPCLKQTCQVLVNVGREPVEFILIGKWFHYFFLVCLWFVYLFFFVWAESLRGGSRGEPRGFLPFHRQPANHQLKEKKTMLILSWRTNATLNVAWW